MAVVDEVLALYEHRESEAYFGDCVPMTEHGLQAAHFAREAGAAPALIVAASCMMWGTWSRTLAKDIADWSTDAEHERVGGAWLAAPSADGVRTGPAARAGQTIPARDPCRLPGDAQPGFGRHLEAARRSDVAREAARFETETFHRDAVLIRRCDDRGKVADRDHGSRTTGR